MAKKATKQAKGTVKTKQRVATGLCLSDHRQVYAHITGTVPQKSGNLKVRWELWKNGVCLETACTPRTHRYNIATESWDTAIKLLVAKAEDAFRAEYRDDDAQAARMETGAHLFSDALASLSEQERGMLRKPTWGERTWNSYYPALRRVCAMLDDLGGDLSPDALKGMRQQYIMQSGASKRSQGTQKVAVYVDQILLAAGYCLTVLRDLVNERQGREALPLVPIWDVITPGKNTQLEQIKWIPEPVLVALAEGLFYQAENGLSMGVALMLTMGLRTSEACAAQFGEMACHEDYVVYPVRTQGAARNKVLKSANAYRDVVTGKLLCDLMAARRAYLAEQGFSQAEIDGVHVVSMPDDPTRPADTRALSTYARSMLLACGYIPEDYSRAAQLMLRQPDYEADGSVMQSVSAYIFRRCYATLISNCCDPFPGTGIVDYLLGHALRVKLPFDATNPEIQRQLARRMDRLVLHPAHTTHPLYAPIPLHSEAPVADLGEHAAYTLEAQEDMEIEITVETREPNGTLSVTTDGAVRVRTVRRQPGTLDSEDARASRPIVLLPPSREAFDEYFRQTRQINFTTLEVPT